MLVFLAALAVAATAPAIANQTIRGSDGLTASVPNTPNCGTTKVTINAPDGSAYTGDRLALHRLLGGVRAAISFDCPDLQGLDVAGFAAGKPAFQARLTANEEWKIPASTTSQIAGTTPRGPVTTWSSGSSTHPPPKASGQPTPLSTTLNETATSPAPAVAHMGSPSGPGQQSSRQATQETTGSAQSGDTSQTETPSSICDNPAVKRGMLKVIHDAMNDPKFKMLSLFVGAMTDMGVDQKYNAVAKSEPVGNDPRTGSLICVATFVGRHETFIVGGNEAAARNAEEAAETARRKGNFREASRQQGIVGSRSLDAAGNDVVAGILNTFKDAPTYARFGVARTQNGFHIREIPAFSDVPAHETDVYDGPGQGLTVADFLGDWVVEIQGAKGLGTILPDRMIAYKPVDKYGLQVWQTMRNQTVTALTFDRPGWMTVTTTENGGWEYLVAENGTFGYVQRLNARTLSSPAHMTRLNLGACDRAYNNLTQVGDSAIPENDPILQDLFAQFDALKSAAIKIDYGNKAIGEIATATTKLEVEILAPTKGMVPAVSMGDLEVGKVRIPLDSQAVPLLSRPTPAQEHMLERIEKLTRVKAVFDYAAALFEGIRETAEMISLQQEAEALNDKIAGFKKDHDRLLRFYSDQVLVLSKEHCLRQFGDDPSIYVRTSMSFINTMTLLAAAISPATRDAILKARLNGAY